MNILEIDNLTFHFHNESPPFFNRLSLHLKEGKIHHLQGKNGAGKSTLFSILNGDLTASGEVMFQGRRTTVNALIPHPSIALVNQRYDTMIADQFTFSENLRFARLSHYPTLFSLPTVDKPLPHFLERFGIEASTPASLLSGGQRQILALMMVLQRSPSLLLLDEPTAALDPPNAQMVFEFLEEVVSAKKATLLVICHDHHLMDQFRTGATIELPGISPQSR